MDFCFRGLCGHESLSIFIHYVLNLLSVLDPASSVFLPRKGRKTCLRPPPEHESNAGCFLKQNTNSQELVFCFTRAGPRGFEPRSTVLETGILPLNYRPLLFNLDSSLHIAIRDGIIISSGRGSRPNLFGHDRASAEIKKSLIFCH